MKPDGGIMFIVDKNNIKYPILITEMKKQGTNDEVIAMTGKAQASGNAIERLGKNVIGLRT
jgi:type II restriction enzyme